MRNSAKNFVLILRHILISPGIKLIYLLLVLTGFVNNLYSQINNTNDSSLTKNKDYDTTKYLSPALFTYAGDRRYTFNGEPPNLKTQIRPATTAVIGSVYLGTLVWLHFHQQNAWWSGNRGKFHFEEDWVSAMQVDKAGHAFGSYIMSYFMSESLIASGLSWDDATLWGSVFALTYQTYVETEDGFAKTWGFSPSDFYFDALGSIFFLSQHYVPALQNITPKWQYIPSEWTGEPIINRPRTFIDDYNSSTFWWSVNVYNLLPENAKKYWVPWLNIAVGYGADAIDANPDPNGPPDQFSKRRMVIGLDYNLVRLLPDGGWFWNWFRQSLNLIKLPSPAVEFSNAGTKFKLFYPFRINLNGFRF